MMARGNSGRDMGSQRMSRSQGIRELMQKASNPRTALTYQRKASAVAIGFAPGKLFPGLASNATASAFANGGRP